MKINKKTSKKANEAINLNNDMIETFDQKVQKYEAEFKKSKSYDSSEKLYKLYKKELDRAKNPSISLIAKVIGFAEHSFESALYDISFHPENAFESNKYSNIANHMVDAADLILKVYKDYDRAYDFYMRAQMYLAFLDTDNPEEIELRNYIEKKTIEIAPHLENFMRKPAVALKDIESAFKYFTKPMNKKNGTSEQVYFNVEFIDGEDEKAIHVKVADENGRILPIFILSKDLDIYTANSNILLDLVDYNGDDFPDQDLVADRIEGNTMYFPISKDGNIDHFSLNFDANVVFTNYLHENLV